MTCVSSRTTNPGMEKTPQDLCYVSSMGSNEIRGSHGSRVGANLSVTSKPRESVGTCYRKQGPPTPNKSLSVLQKAELIRYE